MQPERDFGFLASEVALAPRTEYSKPSFGVGTRPGVENRSAAALARIEIRGGKEN
jgi:hypothetical protein